MPSDEQRLLDLIGEVMGLTDLDELRSGVLEALLRALPSKWASLNEVGPDRVASVVIPDLDESWFERFPELAHENPIYQYWVRTRDGRATRFRDVCTREELESTRLYREIYSHIGVEHQIAITLPNDADHTLAIVLSREDRDFSDAERDFLNRARPFLIQAYRNAVAFTEGRPERLIDALTESGLTTREAEVVRLVALGGSNRDIAARLAVSDRTVQKHLERAFPKLDVTSRSEAASRAWDLARNS